MPDLDLLDFLAADHRNLLESLGVVEVSQHLSVERDFLYPAITDHMGGGEDGAAIVAGLRRAERQLEERLRDFENDASAEHRDRLRAAVAAHIDSQAQLFARLRDLIPESELLTASESIALSIGGSPTHAHPHLADGGFMGKVVEDVTSAADHAVDHWRSRKEPEPS